MLANIAERLSALAPHFARRPQLRLVHQALEAIEAREGLKGVAAYAREHSDGDVKALAACELCSASDWARSMHRLADAMSEDPQPRRAHRIKRLLKLFHEDIDGWLKRTEE